MIASLIWTQDASDDLFNIYLGIGTRSPQAAERVYTAIENLVDLLRLYPRLGVRRPEFRPAFRMLVEAPYLIFYTTVPDTDDGPVDAVSVVRIVRGTNELTLVGRR